MSETTLGWHLIDASRRLTTDGKKPDGAAVVSGGTYEYTGDDPPKCCRCGMHASRLLLDALTYAPGPIICRVRVSEEVHEQKDKLAGRRREVLWMVDATPVLHEFACRCAERALKRASVKDQRCWDAIEMKRLWVRGEATDEELNAAKDTASTAAWDAARVAAWAAAGYAASTAARNEAWCTDRALERDWQEAELVKLVCELPREMAYSEPL